MRDYLMPPLPPMQRTASSQSAPRAEAPVVVDNQGRRFTLDSKVRNTHSFFPCLTSVFNTIRRSLGLSRPPTTPLDASTRADVDRYARFRACESSLRKAVFGKFSDCFAHLKLSARKTESLHRQFHLALDDSLAKSFANVLRDKCAQVPKPDFADALCDTYQSICNSVIDKLLAAPHIYPRGYANTLKAPLNDVVVGLKSSLATSVNPVASTSVSTPALEALVAGNPVLVADTPADGYLSVKDCEKFEDLKFLVCAQVFTDRVAEFEAAGGLKCPKLSIHHFQSRLQDIFMEYIDTLPSSGVPIEDLHAAYQNTMASAMNEAVQEGLDVKDILENEVDGLRAKLTLIRNDINTGLRKSADHRIAFLFQPEPPARPHSLSEPLIERAPRIVRRGSMPF